MKDFDIGGSFSEDDLEEKSPFEIQDDKLLTSSGQDGTIVELETDLSDYIDYLIKKDLNIKQSEQDITPVLDKSTKKSKITKKSLFFEVVVDTEFEGDIALSLQVSVKGKLPDQDQQEVDFSFMVINAGYVDQLPLNEIQTHADKNNFIIYYDFFDKAQVTCPLLKYLFLTIGKKYNYYFTDVLLSHVTIQLWFYYSMKDLNISFGLENMRPYFTGKKQGLLQRRSIFGTLKFSHVINGQNIECNIKLKDLYGIDSNGLAKMASAYGATGKNSIPINAIKQSMDQYKKHMSRGLVEKPIDFITYAMNDVWVTQDLVSKVPESFNKLLKEVFEITEQQAMYHPGKIPMTTGSLVHDILFKYFDKTIFNSTYIKIAFVRMSVLNSLSKTNTQNKVTFSKLLKVRSISELKDIEQNDPVLFKDFLDLAYSKDAFDYTPLQYASIKFIVQKSENTSILSASMVSGGRTVNERPFECFISECVDIDIVGAYSSVLKKLGFPIGRPREFTYSNNEISNKTLGWFINHYKGDLNYYKITVSGMLSFEQDLIFSRDMQESAYQKKAAKFDKENPQSFDVSKPLILLRKEIVNGTITKDIWEAICKVATTNELKEFQSLIVQNAIFWLESDRLSSLDELGEAFLSDKGAYKYDLVSQAINDTRTYKWYLLPLEPLIIKLIDKRAKYKSEKTPQGDAMQNTVKLVLNIIYGIICSRFFLLNNVVVADMITAKIRMAAWYMAKAFNTHLSITDGGPFQLNQVTYLNEGKKKPGISALSSFENYKNHPSLKIGPLDGIDWTLKFKGDPSFLKTYDIKKSINNHIKTFWANYDITIDFDLECKNFISKGSYMLKAHYIFDEYNSNTNQFDLRVVKIRGFKFDETLQYQNPMYYLLTFIVNKYPTTELFSIENSGEYQNRKLLKISSWKLTVPDLTKGISKLGKNVVPGDSAVNIQFFRLNNLHFYLQTLDQYKTRARRGLVRTQSSISDPAKKSPPSMFEKYFANGTIDQVLLFMKEDNLRGEIGKSSRRKNK